MILGHPSSVKNYRFERISGPEPCLWRARSAGSRGDFHEIGGLDSERVDRPRKGKGEVGFLAGSRTVYQSAG